MTENQDVKINEAKPHQNTKILALLTFIAITSLFYALYVTVQMHKQLQALVTVTDTLKQQQVNTQIQLDSRINAINAAQTKLTDHLNAIKKNVQTAIQEHWYQSNDWLLLKARYYLELAAINQNWGDNIQTTKALLQEAQALLTNLHDPRLFAIMQAISKDQAKLDVTPIVDIAALLTQLDAASLMTNQLEIKTPHLFTDTTLPKKVANQLPSTWREHLENSIRRLEQLVIIRHHDEAFHPLVTPTDEAILRDNIHLALQQAQWAVLQQNMSVYTLSLTQAIDGIILAFDPDKDLTKKLVNQLHDLQQIKFKGKQPVSTESLLLINQLIESKQPPSIGEQTE